MTFRNISTVRTGRGSENTEMGEGADLYDDVVYVLKTKNTILVHVFYSDEIDIYYV